MLCRPVLSLHTTGFGKSTRFATSGTSPLYRAMPAAALNFNFINDGKCTSETQICLAQQSKFIIKGASSTWRQANSVLMREGHWNSGIGFVNSMYSLEKSASAFLYLFQLSHKLWCGFWGWSVLPFPLSVLICLMKSEWRNCMCVYI